MRTKRYAGGGDINAKINKLQSFIDNPNTPEADRKNFQEAIKKFKEKLTSEKEPTTEKPVARPVAKKPTSARPTERPTARPVAKKPTSARPTARPTARPVTKKPTSARPTATPVTKKQTATSKVSPIKRKVTSNKIIKKTPKGIQIISKKKVMLNGKEYNTDSKEFCDYLTDEFIKRKEQAKSKKGSRKKTKSVMEQVSMKIEQGVQKAIKTGISKQIPTLKKNPLIFIGKIQKLETANKNFLTQLKEVLGSDYDAKEVTDTTKAIHQMIDELKKKYIKK